MKPVAKTFRTIACLLMVATLVGCGVGNILQSKVDDPLTYILQATDVGTAPVAFPWQLSVALPNAAPGLDTDRIAVLRNSNQLDYYYGARWGSSTPQIMQSFVVALLQGQQGFKGVTAESARVDANYLLDLELRDFQAEYTGKANPIARVTLIGTLIDIKTRKAVVAINSTASVPAKDNRLGEVVAAFQAAAKQASLDMSKQLSAGLEKSAPK